MSVTYTYRAQSSWNRSNVPTTIPMNSSSLLVYRCRFWSQQQLRWILINNVIVIIRCKHITVSGGVTWRDMMLICASICRCSLSMFSHGHRFWTTSQSLRWYFCETVPLATIVIMAVATWRRYYFAIICSTFLRRKNFLDNTITYQLSGN